MDLRKEIPKRELREKFPTAESLYSHLEIAKGFYLPVYEDAQNRDQAITIDYLFDVLNGSAFAIQREAIKKPPRLQKSCLKIELKEKIEKLSSKPCLFPEGRLPAKEWLVEVLYSLNPQDELFVEDHYLDSFANKEV